MKKEITMTAVILLLVGLAAANGPLQDFEFSPSDSFEESFTGGETVRFSAEFTNPVQKDLPLVARLEVSGPEMTDTGEEFEVASSIESEGEELKSTQLECRTRKEGEYIIYDCLKDSEREILADSDNTVLLDAESSPAIAPGDYEMEFSILSMIGVPRNSGSFSYEELTEGITVGKGNTRVVINAEFDSEDIPSGTVEASTMDSIGVEGPLDKYVNGVDVERDEGTDQEDYTADLRIYYEQGEVSDLDENSLTLYRYQPETGSWSEVESDLNTAQNYLEADLTGFSVYAVYGEEQQSGGRTFTIDERQPDQEQTDTDEKDQPPSTPENETENEEETEETGEEERTGEDEGTGEEETGGEQSGDQEEGGFGGSILTGQFAQSVFNPSDLFNSLISLLSGLF